MRVLPVSCLVGVLDIGGEIGVVGGVVLVVPVVLAGKFLGSKFGFADELEF